MEPALDSVAAIMSTPARGIEPDDTLDTAARVMRRAHTRHWPVAHDRELIGMISLFDLLTAQRPETPEERAHRLNPLKAAHVMNRARVVAHPSDVPSHAAALMWRHHLSCMPVVDDGRLLGVITLDDFVAHVARALDGQAPTPVAALMTRAPIATVPVLAPLDEADALMRAFQVRHLPVTRLGRVVGILSDRDVIDAHDRAGEEATELLVGEAMTVAPITVAPDDDARTAGFTLIDRRIGALPVLRGAQLLGVLTKSDYLRYAARVAP